MAGVAAIVGAGAAVASAGSGIAGGILGRSAASKAAAQQQQAISQAVDFQKQVYGTAQGNLQPYIDTGQNALTSVAGAYGLGPQGPAGINAAYKAFQGTPFYTFPLNQGIDAMNRSAAARGLNLSGGQMNALQQYGQDYASKGFSTYLSGLSQLAGVGQQSSVQLGQLGNSAAQSVLSGQAYAGNAAASGTAGAQNATNSGLGQIGNLFSGVSNLIGAFGGQSSGSSYNLGTGGDVQGQVYPNYSGPSGVSPAVDQALANAAANSGGSSGSGP